MTKKKFYALMVIVAGSVCGMQQVALAQTDQPQTNIPEGGAVNFKQMTLMGEEIRNALLSHVDKNPMAPYLKNTLTCSVTGLWECHVWFNEDGTGVLFHAYKKADGMLEMGSAAFSYRMTGKPGDYHLCVTLSGSKDEMCAKQKWDETHYLYDEWFNDYDRPATGSMPAYKSVHEHYAIIPGHR